jgi:hypothetical protein
MLYYQGRVTQNKIHKILTSIGILISPAEVCRIINFIPENVAQERKEAREEAIKKHKYIQVDDTGARIQGRAAFTFVLCNPHFTDFRTFESKSRMSFVQALWGDQLPLYRISRNAIADLKGKIGKKYIKELERLKGDLFYTRDQFERKILRRSPLDELPDKSRDDVITECAIAGYQGTHSSILARPSVILSDDGKNFKRLCRLHALCWIHEIRHYRQMHVFSDYHEKILNGFLNRAWKLYRRIQSYQRHPCVEEKKRIQKEFDDLFTTNTGFLRLDEYLPNSYARKKGLLLALEYPSLPLHNNVSETDLRERVIKRKISYGNRSWAGVIAWDTYMSLMYTCRKLKISFWRYLQDRICRKMEIPALYQVIQAI